MNKGIRVVASGSILTGGTLEESTKLIAELGYKELDLLLITGWAHVGLNDLVFDYMGTIKRIERALSVAGIEAASFNTKYSVALEDEKAAPQRQCELDALLRLMGDLGVKRATLQPTLTNDVSYLRNAFTPTIDEAWRQQAYAAERGLMLSLEPHVMSCICTSKALNDASHLHPELCYVADPSHLIYNGEPMNTIDYLFKQATMVHLRDARKDELFVPYKKGDLDLQIAIETLKTAEYDGPISLEYLSDKYDEFIYADMERMRKDAEAYIKRLE